MLQTLVRVTQSQLAYKHVVSTITYQGMDFETSALNQMGAGDKNLEFNSFRIKKIQLEEIQKIIKRFSVEELPASPFSS